MTWIVLLLPPCLSAHTGEGHWDGVCAWVCDGNNMAGYDSSTTELTILFGHTDSFCYVSTI